MARTTGSDDLFRLVQSLTAEEKGYFKKFARRHSDKDTSYLELFERLADMEVYEEKELKRDFKNLPAEKNYLSGLILDALTLYYNRPGNTHLYLEGLYNRAKILQLKGLPEQARKEFKKGQKIAEQNDMVLAAYRFSFEHSELEKLDVKPADKMKYYAKNYEHLSALLKKEQQALKYSLEENKVRLFLMKTTEGVDFKIDKEDIDLNILFNPPGQLDLKEKVARYEALILYFISMADAENTYLFAKEYHKLTSSQKQWSNSYSRALMFCAHGCILKKDIKEAVKWLDTLKNFRSGNEHINHYNRLRFIYYMLFLHAAANQVDKGMEFARQVWKESPVLFEGKEPHQYYTQYFTHALYLFFYGRDFETCFALLNNMNLSFVRKNTPFSFRDIELTRLMIQAELGNYNLLDSLVRSVAIKFRKYKMEDELTRLLLRFFKALGNKPTEAVKKEYADALNKLLNKKDKTTQANYLHLGLKPYQEWIASLSIKKYSI